MKHLEEETIHAWLDDALDARQSRDIQAHVNACAACAARVAEARGLIAGASRILLALDDAPAGVTPKRSSVAPRRQWRAAPWVTGIAALFLVAVLWRTTETEGGGPGLVMHEMPAVRVSNMDSARPTPLAQLPAPAPAAPRRGVALRGATGAAPAGGSAGAANAAAEAVQMTAGAQERRGRGEAGLAASSLRDERGRASEIAITSAPAQVAAAAAAPAMKDAAEPFRRTTEADSAAAWAGCYNVARLRLRGTVVTTGAAEVASMSRARAAAPSAQSAKAAYASAMPPPMVRLDTVLRPLGYVVRAAQSDSAIGWWRETGGGGGGSADSVRVDLLSGGVLTFARADRVVCPE